MTPHPMWLPAASTRHLRGRRLHLDGEGLLLQTLRAEAAAAGTVPAGPDADVSITVGGDDAPDDAEAFRLERRDGTTRVAAGGQAGALYGWFELVRLGPEALTDALPAGLHRPAHALRMLDHWDNVDIHPVMGQVERGYSGGSIFYDDGDVRADLTRVGEYARLLACVGINRVAINNVNVAAREARLLTEDLAEVARMAEQFRPWGIRVHLSVSFAAPILLGGLGTSDPLDEQVAQWWRDVATRVYELVPDFGGFLVKADSEGQPGPFHYGRDHADGANVLARALAPHDGIVHWRAFVYDHTQDWRDRSTDRARAAFDHFTPLDGRFDPNVVVQVKHGPMDFQVREPVSPLLAAMPDTSLALELQVTQEYTGQQRHAVFLGRMWSQVLGFRPGGDDAPTVAELAGGGVAAVSNVGDDLFWTGHPLAQSNLYAFGRLAWDPQLAPSQVLDEWIRLTFGDGEELARVVHDVLDCSWETYEDHTAPLGVGFMVNPGHHYGPSVDGYEYTPWGTYHFADRDGIGVDRSVATGTGFAGQYPEPWRSRYEDPATTPDELLLFFHHVPWTHRLHSGRTVIQHVYDTHFEGVEQVERVVAAWESARGRVDDALFERVAQRLTEQLRSAVEWRDQVNTYCLRKSGIADEHGRRAF